MPSVDVAFVIAHNDVTDVTRNLVRELFNLHTVCVRRSTIVLHLTSIEHTTLTYLMVLFEANRNTDTIHEVRFTIKNGVGTTLQVT
jgi:hypothetical protein